MQFSTDEGMKGIFLVKLFPVSSYLCIRGCRGKRGAQASYSQLKGLPVGCHRDSIVSVAEGFGVSSLERVQCVHNALDSPYLFRQTSREEALKLRF